MLATMYIFQLVIFPFLCSLDKHSVLNLLPTNIRPCSFRYFLLPCSHLLILPLYASFSFPLCLFPFSFSLSLSLSTSLLYSLSSFFSSFSSSYPSTSFITHFSLFLNYKRGRKGREIRRQGWRTGEKERGMKTERQKELESGKIYHDGENK